jgi:hypothetical protein
MYSIIFDSSIFFVVVLEFEFKALGLLFRRSTT